MLRKKVWLCLGIAGAAVLALSVGLLTVGCGGGNSGGGIPKELQGKWQAVGDDAILDLTSGSFESMPASGSAYSQKIRKTRSASYDYDDTLWALRCVESMKSVFTDGYIMVGLAGNARANNRTITITITSIFGGFWNDIWEFMSILMKCVLLRVFETIPFFGPSDVNGFIEHFFVPLGVNANKWYSKNELKSAIERTMRNKNDEYGYNEYDAEDITFMKQMVDAIFTTQTISYELNDAKDELTIYGTDGNFTVYQSVQIIR